MEEISKKDLLKITGISYGQLYRWKRKGLIPEEWFIKRASFTGQETYFPKDLILERIDKILELKDDVSLEDLSDIINSNTKATLHRSELFNKNLLINTELINLLKNDIVDFNDIVILKILDNITSKEIYLNELYTYLSNNKDEIINYNFIYLILNNNDIGCILVKEPILLEYNLNNTIKVNLKSIIDNLKLVIFI